MALLFVFINRFDEDRLLLFPVNLVRKKNIQICSSSIGLVEEISAGATLEIVGVNTIEKQKICGDNNI